MSLDSLRGATKSKFRKSIGFCFYDQNCAVDNSKNICFKTLFINAPFCGLSDSGSRQGFFYSSKKLPLKIL